MTTQADVVRSPTEVPEKARRRRFTAEYKRKVLQEADGCTKQGELAALRTALAALNDEPA